MKRTIAFLTLLALVALPASVMAAKTGDFELGGYIKLHTWWDSTNSANKNYSIVNTRNNAFRPAHEGKFRMTAQDTRFNFKIKGPDVWGAQTQGYIEVDFDGSGQDPQATVTYAVQPRLRHAWFRFDWPGGWQLLMGQYWGVFCNFWPDTVQSGPLFGHGMATQRLPQIRITYKGGPWTLVALAGVPNDEFDNGLAARTNLFGFPWQPGNAANFPGGRTSMPQFGLQAEFEQDLWGKAAFFGRPRGFAANVSFGIQRMKYDGGGYGFNVQGVPLLNAFTFGQNNFGGSFVFNDGETLTPWMVQASLFIPVIATQTEDLRGTMSVQLQFYVGQGLRAFGNDFLGGNNSYFDFDSLVNQGGFANLASYDRKLMKRYGGYGQVQYYFNNQWHLSYLFGFSKAYGVTQDRNPLLVTVANPEGFEFATTGDPAKMIQEHDLSLFYRPVKNFKFGLSYAYLRTDYFQITTVGSRQTSLGENHRVQFAGWFFF